MNSGHYQTFKFSVTENDHTIYMYNIHLPAKMQGICHVNSIIHESETISWRHLRSMHVINNAECAVILLTIASAGGPPLNISPSLICMCTALHVKFIQRCYTRLDTFCVLLILKCFLPSLHDFLVDIPRLHG